MILLNSQLKYVDKTYLNYGGEHVLVEIFCFVLCVEVVIRRQLFQVFNQTIIKLFDSLCSHWTIFLGGDWFIFGFEL